MLIEALSEKIPCLKCFVRKEDDDIYDYISYEMPPVTNEYMLNNIMSE